MTKQKFAFTLAEVLIVIGIIGVVAALTLPNLNHATGDKERITKVKKIYSALTEAFDRAQAIYGDYSTWFNDLEDSNGDLEESNRATASERFAKRVTEFMKVSKDCEFDSGCFSNVVTSLYQNITQDSGSSNLYKVILSDGIALSFDFSGTIYVDIDGPNKGTSMMGKDIFMFIANKDNSMIVPNFSGPGSGPFFWGFATAKWIIENDNADYLKADESGKCNDSDIILNGTTNTSCH